MATNVSSRLQTSIMACPLVGQSRRTILLLIFTIILTTLIDSQVDAFYNTNDPEGFDDYILNNLQLAESEANFMENNLPIVKTPSGSVVTMKRSCIRRSGICDARPSDCCLNSVCRCNLWGANCRCQRMGLFQRLGRK
ncbi:uncharacterized protein LOC112538862 [Tetranychus urticae]|uniref:Agouti domain-containing protein n=1 Tax=Tetranychus urticae TaxID=32264 RepID=T1KBA4_TETUR|nr:uncharacterized protein LOC112538862 [Tetranychus urticae]